MKMIKRDNKFAELKQLNEILNFRAYDNEKITHKMTSEMRENFALSTVGYELFYDKDNEKEFPFSRFLKMLNYFSGI